MRTGRSTTDKTYTYTYNGSQLVQMTVGSDVLRFAYDAAGTPLTVTYDGDTYYYVTNIQGDVVAIVDASGVQQVRYTYGAWGQLLSTTGTLATTLGTHNPLRYRGYVYDAETALYYLQSRYYDPDVGRFVNGDAYTTTGQKFQGNNMYVYCINNPVCMADYAGEDAIYVVDFTIGPGLPIVGHAYAYIQDENGVWYKTEFAVSFSDGFSINIRTAKANVSQMAEIESMYRGEYVSDHDYIVIEGDFAQSLKIARVCNKTNYGGYDFILNNCMHYVQDILLLGTFSNNYIREAMRGYYGPVPAELAQRLHQAEIISQTVNTLANGVKWIGGQLQNGWNSFQKWFCLQ